MKHWDLGRWEAAVCIMCLWHSLGLTNRYVTGSITENVEKQTHGSSAGVLPLISDLSFSDRATHSFVIFTEINPSQRVKLR